MYAAVFIFFLGPEKWWFIKIDDTLIITISTRKLGGKYWGCYFSFSQMMILKYFGPYYLNLQNNDVK